MNLHRGQRPGAGQSARNAGSTCPHARLADALSLGCL